MEQEQRPHRRHEKDIQAAVIARCLDGDEAITQVAAELGVSHKTAWGWVKRERMRRLDPEKKLPQEVRQRLVEEQLRNAKLQRENEELQRQLEFAKKAAAFFRETDQRGTDSR
jgi:transposase